MNFKHGRNRLVLLFPLVVIVIKFPKIFLRDAIKSFWYSVKRRDFINLIKELTLPIEADEIKFSLFQGISENLREFKCSGFLFQKTYFSLFGLLNIQKYGKPVSETVDVWHILYSIATEEQKDLLMKDIHHLSQNNNFCIDDGILKLCDYGGKKTKKVVSELGEDFFRKASLIVLKNR